MATYGIEEEVFVTEPERPTLRSLYFLTRLMARDPRFYYTHSASNFSRGKDVKQGLVSGIEISTPVCENAQAAATDLENRRKDLAAVCKGLIVPIGHLLDYDSPTNTCAMQIHVGGVEDKQKLYNNLLHFLPILSLFTINSPASNGERFGKSYRICKSWAIGPILDNWEIRFQDMILSKRLGTIELRVFDPCWDMKRIRALLAAIQAIAELDEQLEPNTDYYNTQRQEMGLNGLLDANSKLLDELKLITNIDEQLLVKSASDEMYKIYKSNGLVGAYSAADNAYRNGIFEPRDVKQKQKLHLAKGIIGLVGYYLPRLPYYAWKGIVEN